MAGGRGRSRGRGGRLSRRVAGIAEQLRRDTLPFPRMVRSSARLLEPPPITTSWKSISWVRSSVSRPATGAYNYTVGNILTSMAFSVTNTQATIRVSRIRVMVQPKSVTFLTIYVKNEPATNARSTRFTSTGNAGVQMACIDVELPFSWITQTFVSGDSDILATIVSVDTSGNVDSVVCDALVELVVYGGTVSEQMELQNNINEAIGSSVELSAVGSPRKSPVVAGPQPPLNVAMENLSL